MVPQDSFPYSNPLNTSPSFISNPYSHPISQEHMSYREPHPPLQIIQEEQSMETPHSSIRLITSEPILASQIPQNALHQSHPIGGNGGFSEMMSVPTYPVYYPMKKATKFNLFSCFDDIGHDSFHA